MGICCCMICFHILKVKAETGATERRREAVTKTSEEDHDREKVKNRKKVIVYEAYPKNGKKIFDDSCKVDLEVRAQWEGGKPDAEAADLVVCGYAVSKNVGIWRVDVEYEIAGTDADTYVLECRKAALETKVEIVPKILQVSISDANKGYFADNKTENLRFSDEKNAIQISGFMKNGEASNQPPGGFVMPKVWIDENVLQKDSPIYQNGQYLVYQGALTLKEEVAGKNANYCYAPEDKRYTAKGDVILKETDPNPENIKIRARYGKCVYDSKRKVYRISKGAILEAQPTKGSGYNQTNVSQPLYGEGRWSFVMERRQKNGELQARSKKTEISYEVDEEAPSAEVRLNGKKQKQLFTSDFCVCSAENVQDDTEGEVQIQWYLAREKLDDGQITQKQGEWREGKQIEIQEEGIWYPYVKLTDAFGNARYLPVGKVVIDRTSPEIVIQGMPQNQILLSDYKVKISLEEFYLNQKKSYIKLYKRTGRSAKEEQLLDMPVNWKKGKAELKDKKNSGSNTGESGDDVYLKDGWYRLKIYAEDLAGNQEEQEICFAVNRSGPKLTTDASMQKFLKQKTAQQGQKLKLRVWDVNKMQKEELQCIFDGKARNLEEGKDYQKKYRPTAEGFTEYDYEVSEAVFEKEGRYSLKLFLEDEAGHRLSEKEKTLCRDFAIDRTPPICVIDPIKVTEKGFQVQTICEDNVDFAKIWLCKNGSLYKESKNQESSWEISFGHGEKWQLEVFDTAGNKEVRYLLKEELEKELERKKLLPEKKGKHKNRIFETQKQTENGTHGEKQKKTGFLQKETNSLSNEPERQEQEKDRDEGQMTVTVVCIVLSGLSGMLYWVKHRQKVQI